MPCRKPEIHFEWKKLNKFVEINNDEGSSLKQILFDVTGEVHPGEMIALMGPSGSGKTTLLNILGCRALSHTKGKVLVNGQRLSKSMKRVIAYVLQDDIFFNHLTVREQLTFTARLRLPETLGSEGLKEEVDRVISQLNLQKCADTELMLVSGGEKKRTNIGTELLTNPSAILLDEPTSGLDSTSASLLTKTLRSLALQRKTVICSIHQPSTSIFYSFDTLVLLCNGRLVYHGKPTELMSYLRSLSLADHIGDVNPSDYVMDLITSSDNLPSPSLSEETHGVTDMKPRDFLIQSWKDLEEAKLEANDSKSNNNNNDDDDDAATNNSDDSYLDDDGPLSLTKGGNNKTNGTDTTMGGSKFATSYKTQFQVLLVRAWIQAKSVLFTTLNLVQCVVIAVLCGLLWFQMEEKEKHISDVSSFVFFFMTFWFFSALFKGLMSFPSERKVILKERASGSYHLSAYFLAKTFSETPLQVSMPLIYLIISYWMANLNNSFVAFLGMTCTELIATLAGESMGLWIGATWMDFEKCLVIATIVSLTLMLLGGFFIENVPGWMEPLSYLSPFRYSYYGSLHFQYPDDVRIACDGSDILPECQLGATHVTGKEVRDYLGVEGSLGFNVGMLIVIVVTFRIISYLSLRFLNHNKGRQ